MKTIPEFDPLEFGSAALRMRSYRGELLGSNLVNSDTPNFKAKDINFADALRAQLTGSPAGGSGAPKLGLRGTDGRHYRTNPAGQEIPETLYRVPVQPSLDGNTVDPDVERSKFAENAFHTEATITFLNSTLRSRIQAITGQTS